MSSDENGGALDQKDTAAQTLVTTTDDNSQGNTSTKVEVVNPDLIRSWAEPILKAVRGPVPIPGTDEWCALADDDVRKRAAVIYAAVWWCEQHTAEAIAQRADRDMVVHLLDEKQFARTLAASRNWGSCVSWQELQRRRTTYVDRPPIDPVATERWVRTGSSKSSYDDLGRRQGAA